jgi:hypothetical protein
MQYNKNSDTISILIKKTGFAGFFISQNIVITK